MPRLAIAGGPPAITKHPPSWPQFDERERKGLLEVLEGRNWGGYPFPNRLAALFAERFAAAHGAAHGVPVANGTVAIEVALKSAGVGPGDEVIVPAYTFEATAVPVLRLGAVPRFVDVLRDTYCIDPAAAEASVTGRTRAVLPVHLAMGMADMDALCDLATRHGLVVIEDCAHAHGAKWRGRGAGSIGDAGCFSMQTTKLLTAGEGGVVTTRREEVLELAQTYVNCGRASERDRFGRRIVGFNYRMTEFQAAVLLAQLERLPEQTRVREERSELLASALERIPGISLLRRDERITARAVYQYIFRYDAREFGGASRDRFVAALESEGVACDGLFYEPVYRSALFRVAPGEFPGLSRPLPWEGTRCPVAERAAYEEAVWIPHPYLLGEPDDVLRIAEAVEKIRENADELVAAEHPLIALKSQSRASRARR